MHPKLLWTQKLASSLGLAMGTSVEVRVRDDEVDPLKKHVDLVLGDDLRKGDYNPVQTMVHAFAKMNDCIVYKIRRHPNTLLLEVLIKNRISPEMNRNPLSSDKDEPEKN